MKVLMIVSGGDAPGINAALWHSVVLAEQAQDQVWGAPGGLPGVLEGQLIPLGRAPLTALMGLGGSYLASSREPVLAQPAGQARLRAALSAAQVDAVILFGGNGSLHHVLPRLADCGVACIGLPTTIDNDVPGSEYTLGFDSACNYAAQAVDGARNTGLALPGRLFTVETLGGHTGFIALAVAQSAGATAVLIPEIPFDEDWLAERMQHAAATIGYALCVLSEGVTMQRPIAPTLQAKTGIRVRDVRLGHAQRGGLATHRDRAAAAAMMQLAWDGLRAGVRQGIVLLQNGQWRLHAGTLAGLPAPEPDQALYRRINGLPADASGG